jgi:hypothetical protein
LATESQRSVKARKGNGGQGAKRTKRKEESEANDVAEERGTLTTVHQNVSHTVTIRLHKLTASDRDRWLE